jgi:hypothetical protein
MTYYDDLPVPPTAGLSPQERSYLAYDLERVAIAARERAGVLYAACDGRAALAIHELVDFADRVHRRAQGYRHA